MKADVLIVHCCTRLSVDRILRLGTGWEPPICGSKMFERLPRPHLTKKFNFFLQKGHGTPNSWPENFFSGSKKNFIPPNWLFFGGSVTFPKLRAHFQNLHLLIIFSLPRKASGNLQLFFSCACPIYGNSWFPFLDPFFSIYNSNDKLEQRHLVFVFNKNHNANPHLQ